MIQYTIQFELFSDKLDEFLLSWESFHQNISETEGLNKCVMFEKEENNFEIVMTWSDKFYLNMFLKGDWNNFLHGAISVLGNENMITQKLIH
jgi:hypothetical protein